MNEEEIDYEEHWSYTIMGNWRALKYDYDFFMLCNESLTMEESNKTEQLDYSIPNELWIVLIERCYEKLIEFVENEKSRLAYLVLGAFLMEKGGKMTKQLKEKILYFSDWKFEKDQFKNSEEQSLRKKYLNEFRQKVINYKDGIKSKISQESLEDIYKKNSPLELTSISYKI